MVFKTHEKEKIVLRALLCHFNSLVTSCSVHVYALHGLMLNFIGSVHLPRSRSAGEELGRLIKEKDEQIAQLMEEGNVHYCSSG